MTDFSDERMQAEIDTDRRGEHRVVWQAVIAVAVVVAFACVRFAIVGWAA